MKLLKDILVIGPVGLIGVVIIKKLDDIHQEIKWLEHAKGVTDRKEYFRRVNEQHKRES